MGYCGYPIGYLGHPMGYLGHLIGYCRHLMGHLVGISWDPVDIPRDIVVIILDIPAASHGQPVGTPWNSVGYAGIPGACHGTSRVHPMAYRRRIAGIPWTPHEDPLGIPCDSMGLPWDIVGIPRGIQPASLEKRIGTT